MTRACVIGAGLGGLALAIRLQAAGIDCTLMEARDHPGGYASSQQREGFTFESGPMALIDPASFDDLWQLAGRRLADDVELLPVSPATRFNWPDGGTFDYYADEAALRHELARVMPEDAAGYEEYAHYAAQVLKDGTVPIGTSALMSVPSVLRALPRLARNQFWRSLHSMVAGHVKGQRLREALTAEMLMIGANPVTARALQAIRHAMEQQSGVWWPKGGFGKLTSAMAALFEQLGGSLRLKDPVLHIHTLGDRASEVECVSGWRERFDAVASNADVVHSYRDLLAGTQRGGEMARSLVRKHWSPSMFVVHFGLEGGWPGIPHRTVLLGNRYKPLLTDLFEHGVLPRDFILFLDHPSVTDDSMAPPGKSTFRAMIPVANQGKLPIDWEQTGPMIERRILDEVGRRLIPDLEDRIVTRFHYTPRDYALDMNAHNGSPFGLEPLMGQSGPFRPHNRDGKLKNVYLVGASTHPGAGLPAVLQSAMATARAMQEDIRK